MEPYVKNAQEQAVAAWADYLNQIRLNRLMQDLLDQDKNLEAALSELQKVKDFIGDPSHILGSATTKHGEIAEHMQVNFSNARRLVDGFLSNYDIDSVGRTAAEDYLRDGNPVQSKFLHDVKATLNGSGNASGIFQHFIKYQNDDFIKKGGTYDIPKDQYLEIQRVLTLRETAPTQLTRSDLRILEAIDYLESKTGLKIGRDVRPSVVDYSEVQQNRAGDTIEKETHSIREKDQSNRDSAYQRSKPTIKEGASVTVVSAISEGGVAFCLGVAGKLREGKKLADFTEKDWKEVGLDAGKGTIKGGIRGSAVYAMSNFTATPACVASSFVSAAFGVISQADQLRKHEISDEDFIINSQVVCLDATISTISAALGQIAIPVPILGAVIGSVAGTFVYGIAKQCNLQKEESVIKQYQNELKELNSQYNEQYQQLISMLNEKFEEFQSLLEFAFDEDINTAFASSIALAQSVGVEESKIVKSLADIDAYFLM